ncbi:AraC family transcriptional regulator, partial [Xanthomonas sp. Kuri4-1]
MNIEKTPAPPGAPVVRPELATWFERAGGPPVVVFQVHSQQGLAHEIDWHRHLRGQLISVESGLLTTRTERGEWSLPPGCAGWMPPDALHTVEITGPLRGWGLLVEPAACATLPARPCVLGIGELVR